MRADQVDVRFKGYYDKYRNIWERQGPEGDEVIARWALCSRWISGDLRTKMHKLRSFRNSMLKYYATSKARRERIMEIYFQTRFYFFQQRRLVCSEQIRTPVFD